MSATTPNVHIAGLSKSFGWRPRRVISDVGFEAGRGEVVALVGPNGAGKTTLMGCLVGLVRPDRGEVLLGGESPECATVRAFLGYMPERPVIPRGMTGRAFLELHASLARIPRADEAEVLDAALRKVRLAPEALSRPLSTWSQGMLRRVNLAQALLVPARWLFLDEPTTGLDPEGVAILRDVLRDAASSGATIVMTSHHLDHVVRTCSRVLVMKQGRLVDDLDPSRAGLARLEAFFDSRPAEVQP